MLDNQTSNEADQTPAGHERLKVLLLHDQQYDLKNDGNLFEADINYLRTKLGLTL